ncbi:MAG: hypothetical protein M5U12_36210 [Verrucomicrobia bacterium]|nr:hypothetical protein [Verrucomicrobiota bacterium]
MQVVLRREHASFNPVELFVFLDEAEDSIDDGHLLVWPRPDTRWVNLPAGRDNQLGVLSFADDHEKHCKSRGPTSRSPRAEHCRNHTIESVREPLLR